LVHYVSTCLSFVEKHPDIVDRFLKGICEGIAYFKTHRAESIKIIKDEYKYEGDLDDESANHLYNELSKILQAKPYATIQAISNVYEISIVQNKAAEQTDPMALWVFIFYVLTIVVSSMDCLAGCKDICRQFSLSSGWVSTR
jgi:hypothetical protein